MKSVGTAVYGGGLTWKLSAVATLAALPDLPAEAVAELEAREEVAVADTEVARLLLEDRLSKCRGRTEVCPCQILITLGKV